MNALLKRPTGVALSALTILRKILRKFFRLILLISLLGGLFTVTARYGVPSYEVPKPPRLEEAGRHPLKTLKPVSKASVLFNKIFRLINKTYQATINVFSVNHGRH